MSELLRAALYLGGNLVIFWLLFLPALALLVISVLFIAGDTIHHFRRRQGRF